MTELSHVITSEPVDKPTCPRILLGTHCMKGTPYPCFCGELVTTSLKIEKDRSGLAFAHLEAGLGCGEGVRFSDGVADVVSVGLSDWSDVREGLDGTGYRADYRVSCSATPDAGIRVVASYDLNLRENRNLLTYVSSI